MTKRLVALDIDGTLLAPGVSHDALPDANMTDAVQQLMASGTIVVLASGRMYPGTAMIAEHFGITQPLICQQGASIHHLDGSLHTRREIHPEIAHAIAELAEAEGWPYAWFDAQRYLVSQPSPAADHFARVSGVDVEIHPDPRTSGVVPTGVDVISTPDHSNDLYQRLKQRFGTKIGLLDFVSVTAAHANDANKGLALERLAAEFGVAQQDTVAIGDSVNDVSMLEWAGLGAAPDHCDDHARRAADRILGENSDAGSDGGGDGSSAKGVAGCNRADPECVCCSERQSPAARPAPCFQSAATTACSIEA